MCPRSIRSRQALVRGLSLLLFLLLPWPVPAEEGAALPLSKIVLYSSGVGYFQHDGTVNNRMQLDLLLHANQINDMLKSLVVQDFGGGRISPVTYGSRDPVTKTLGSFGINLNGNPTLGQILTQVRGEPVEVAAPNPIVGTLLGVEKKAESIGEGSQHRVIEQEYLTLLTEEGFRSLSLANVQRIKLTNPSLNTELHQALAILATNHDTQKKTVSITFDGTGSRQVRVAYLPGLEDQLSTHLGGGQGTLSARLGHCGKSNITGLAQRETLSCLRTTHFLRHGSVSTALQPTSPRSA